jgi:aryl-alcohol dehydrogenase-like predicted oxidoreductase
MKMDNPAPVNGTRPPGIPPALSPISLGCVTFGREIDEPSSRAIMDHAHARGITLFDTATTYGNGSSERIVGAWLSSRRPGSVAPAIATKLYPPYTQQSIIEGAAACVGRLGVATIDLLYLHAWDESAQTPGVLIALDDLVRSGRVRAIGASNFTASQLATVLEQQAARNLSRIRYLQNNNNLAVRDVDAPLRALCADHGVALITYSPLGAGFLTGKHLGGLQPGTRFAIAPGHQAIYFQPTAQRRLARLMDVSRRTGHSPSHLALAWALHQPGVASVLIGCRSPAHVDQALAALALDDSSLFAELESC